MGLSNDTKTLQTFLNDYGYSKQAIGTLLAVDGVPGEVTKKVIEYFQTVKKIAVDGIPGPQTRKEVIKVIQADFNTKGISKLAIDTNLVVDGVDGPVTEKVAFYLQKVKGITQDGIIGSITINALVNYNTNTTSTNTGYVGVNYTMDTQDTNYSCGASASKMLFSVHGLNLGEGWLISVLGSKPEIGTPMTDMHKGPDAVNKNYGKSFKSAIESFQSWERLQNYIKAKNPPILRIKSFLTSGEHYTLLAGIDISKDYAILGDPSHGGRREVKLPDLRDRIRRVNGASIFVVTE